MVQAVLNAGTIGRGVDEQDYNVGCCDLLLAVPGSEMKTVYLKLIKALKTPTREARLE
jgi:hypothetical protein